MFASGQLMRLRDKDSSLLSVLVILAVKLHQQLRGTISAICRCRKGSSPSFPASACQQGQYLPTVTLRDLKLILAMKSPHGIGGYSTTTRRPLCLTCTKVPVTLYPQTWILPTRRHEGPNPVSVSGLSTIHLLIKK